MKATLSDLAHGLVRKGFLSKTVLLISGVIVLSLATSISYATDFYVDQSCSVQGNGTADQCASSSGGSGAFTGLQDCFSAVGAGDTCFIKNGTYITSYRTNTPWYDGGFHIDGRGQANAPVTITNYPGHKPLIANCSATQTTYCANPTITAPMGEYVIIDGLVVRGSINMYGDFNNHTRGNIIRNTEITVGWGGVGDGNWSGIFLQNQSNMLIRGNYIHNLFIQDGGGQQSSASCVKMYHLNDSIVEFNTCRNVNIGSAAGGLDDKAQATRNILRYNWLENVPTGIRINNQLQSTGDQIYGNVVICSTQFSGGAGIKLLANIDGIDIYNNTIAAGCTHGLTKVAGAAINDRFYNNIVMPRDNNTEWYSNVQYSNYNAFTPSKRYRSAAGWQQSLSGFQASSQTDINSMEVNCGFITTNSNYRLQNDSVCNTLGRVGGQPSGNVVQVGAYGVTQCVGHLCVGDPKRPSNPTALLVQ